MYVYTFTSARARARERTKARSACKLCYISLFLSPAISRSYPVPPTPKNELAYFLQGGRNESIFQRARRSLLPRPDEPPRHPPHSVGTGG